MTRSDLESPLPVVGVSSEVVQLDESVCVSGCSVAQTVAFPQETSLPHYFPTHLPRLQVPTFTQHL
jgi:hypothetical protein